MTHKSTLFVDLDNTIMINPFKSAIFPIICGELAAKTTLTPEVILDLIIEEQVGRESQGVDAAKAMDWDDIVQTIALRLGVSFTRSIQELVVESARYPHIQILDNAADVLVTLSKNQARRMIAVSKGLSKYQRPVLEALQLIKYFDTIITPDTCGYLKNDKRFYHPYMTDSQLLIVVGDTYVDDVFYPKTFGFETVWVCRTMQDTTLLRKEPFERAVEIPLPEKYLTRPDAVVVHLEELPRVIERIEAGLSNGCG